jgi:hypothetical protein
VYITALQGMRVQMCAKLLNTWKNTHSSTFTATEQEVSKQLRPKSTVGEDSEQIPSTFIFLNRIILLFSCLFLVFRVIVFQEV